MNFLLKRMQGYGKNLSHLDYSYFDLCATLLTNTKSQST